MSDFYEDDERVEDVIAAFERGKKGATAPHVRNIRASSSDLLISGQSEGLDIVVRVREAGPASPSRVTNEPAWGVPS
jgi:hypothetical protein